jgi:plasmid stabilization system protein ParE
MAKRLRYHPLVAQDIAAAIDWYEGRSVGLGERFRAAVDARFDDIVDAPEMFPHAFDDSDFRFARIRKFPYLLLFRVRAEIVQVIGLFHSASDPTKWRRRARNW